MKTITPEMVRETLHARMESDMPEAVLEVLKTEDGKQLTKRLLAKLAGGEAEWRLRFEAGMAHLETWTYCRSQGKTGICLLLAYATKSVTIDAAWVEEHNAGYFAARRLRNAERKTTLQSPLSCGLLAEKLNRVARAREELAKAEVELSELTGYGKAFGPDQYTWEALVKGEEK